MTRAKLDTTDLGPTRRRAARTTPATVESLEVEPRRGRRPSNGSQRTSSRERLLKAAREEFVLHGFAGARVDKIVRKAGSNPRMVYHYFGSKSGLYVAVLEAALGDLRAQELQLDVEHLDPLDGLVRLFDFMNDHFEGNQSLVRLLTNENLQKARFMRTSKAIREMASPVLSMISRFISRGTADGVLTRGLDPLRVYVMMVALAQFHLSNVHTLSVIFDRDLSARDWRAARRADARRMLLAYFTRHPG
ncbi:MAG: TetR family transcriptional regulator [Bauldia sp.]|nr:TetR family transcriptional regulator [Bauldia sp.]